ncbi:nose resistant to fluoxetine protein 6-like [Coccinella septempunctata]|uniref:nose resistant to fluoxetine protein 6-like n=1 Tax=Coccinella septempunctata TaxID=41139 RepID=UPI001D094113|nr:nose resistant to fluoxetine protein 6-like [Coccinella septempunctata]
MFRFLFCLLFFNGLSHATVSVEEIFEDGIPEDCLKIYKKLDPLVKVKMFDATSKLITNGLMDGNFVDLGDFDECLSITDDKTDVVGKYCMATVDLNHFLANLKPSKTALTSLLVNETQNKIAKLTDSKLYGSTMSSMMSLYTTFARFGVCLPDECKVDNIAFLKINEEKCYTKYTNEDMDLFPFFVLLLLYVIILIAVVSTVYDIILQNASMKPKHEIMVAFSLYTNGKKLLSTNRTSRELSCLYGIKVFSMMWVVLGHSYLNMLTTSVDNILYINDWMDNPINMVVVSATLSVDTFFTIGGLLTVYVFMNSKPIETREAFKKIPFLYLHRYLRLTPAFAMMVLIYASGLIKYIGNGPKWYTLDSTIETCKENWWLALLYVQNYLDYSKMCVVQSWYLSADFQLFIVTPFLLIPLKKYSKYIMPSLYAVAVAGMIVPFFIGYTNKWTGVGLGSISNSFADNYYFVTHARFAPYFIGMIAGYYVYVAKKGPKELKLQKRYLIPLWILTLVGIIGCIFDGYKLIRNTDNQWTDGIYMGFNRSAWSISISLLIFLCSTNNGGPIQTFLSLPLFQVVSKLTYSMYLVHYIVILCVNAASRTELHFSNFTITTYFITYFVITLTISVFYSLIFESPMITIERILFPTDKRNKTSNELPK